MHQDNGTDQHLRELAGLDSPESDDAFAPNEKSPVLAAVLAFFLGPLGLLYADPLVGCAVTILVGAFTFFSTVTRSYYLLVVNILLAILAYRVCRQGNETKRSKHRKESAYLRMKTLWDAFSNNILKVTATIKESVFGELPDGQSVRVFTLSNILGIKVQVAEYGARVVSIETPDRQGSSGEITVGFKSLADCLEAGSHYGGILGRVAGRMHVGDKSHPVPRDQRALSAAGDKSGFHDRMWHGSVEDNRVRFVYVSPDGEEGYPGEVTVRVWYSLEGSDLRVEYEAVASQETPIDLTNHIVFNLSCFSESVFNARFRVQSDKYLPLNDKGVSTGEVASVHGTRFDFTSSTDAWERVSLDPCSTKYLDHYFPIDSSRSNRPNVWMASALDLVYGRSLKIGTSQPGLQFGFDVSINVPTSVALANRGGRGQGFFFDPQYPPLSVDLPGIGKPTLRPGETYRQTTIYRFGVAWDRVDKEKE